MNSAARAFLIAMTMLLLAPALSRPAAAQECDSPNMLIVLDKSGSMGAGTWTNATYYAALGSTPTTIRNKINGVGPGGGTPTGGTMLNCNNSNVGLHDPGRLNFIMFITDGEPTCPNGGGSSVTDADKALAINATASLFSSGVKTFVIGMGNASFQDVLNGMAEAGGTARSGATKYYPANDLNSLKSAMDTIAQIATRRPCQNACGTGYETCDLVNKKWVNCNAPTNCCTDTNEPCDTGKLGICSIGAMKCVNAVLTCVQTNQPQGEQCDAIDNDCNGTPDDGIAPQVCSNSCGHSGSRYCVNGQWSACDAEPCCTDTNAPCNTGQPGICADGRMQCVNDILTCVRINQPQPLDICNGLDDNCDGQVDENDPGGGAQCNTGMLGVCAGGHMHCRGGRLVCVPDQLVGPEECNGLDDDCDGVADNGNPGGGAQCDTGLKGECRFGLTKCEGGTLTCTQVNQPSQEKCDGLDNNCDGAVDEGNPGGGKVCPTGNKGECSAGHTKCEGGQIVCQQDKLPRAEICDGLDNDCDGVADNGDPGGGAQCDTGLFGECAAGTLHCKNKMLQCVQDRQPETEKCDGIDNDCNGLIDNGNPGGGKLCSTGKPGICAVGHTKCENASIICVPDHEAEAEKCDGLDNDCDGAVDDGVTNACGYCGEAPKELCNGRDDDCDGDVDNNAECPPGKFCINGDCVERCVNNECPGDLMCKAGYCVPPCNGVRCEPDEDCDNGICTNLCAAVKCDAGEVCRHGECLEDDCYKIGCLSGKICRDGKCGDDPCADAACDPQKDEFCRDGTCVASCAKISCGFGERCADGECVPDQCFEVKCETGKVCNDSGECAEDPCKDQTCGPGRICADGVCEDDPCAAITCPHPGEVCVRGQCEFPSGGEDAGTPDGGAGDAGGEAGPGEDGETDGGEADADTRESPRDVGKDSGHSGASEGSEDDVAGAGGDGGEFGQPEGMGGCSCATLGF